MRALELTYGKRLETLPWSRPEAARAALDDDALCRLHIAKSTLESAWLSEAPWAALPIALATLFPRSSCVSYGPPAPQLPSWFITNARGMSQCDSVGIRHLDRLPKIRKYHTQKRDPYANRPVNFATLYRTEAEFEATLEGILKPNGVDHQLRTVFYEGDRMLGYMGVYRERIDLERVHEDHALFFAASALLRDWLANLDALGMVPVGDGRIANVLDGFDEVAFLVRDDAIVHANHAARLAWVKTPDWLDDLDGAAERGLIRLTPLILGGRAFTMVVDRTPQRSLFDHLPATLQPIAWALAEGEADKDIALRTGYALSTVRTYVQRVLTRLGVQSRRDVMRLAHGRMPPK